MAYTLLICSSSIQSENNVSVAQHPINAKPNPPHSQPAIILIELLPVVL